MKIRLIDLPDASRFWYLNFYRENENIIELDLEDNQIVMHIPDILDQYIDTMQDNEFSKYINWDYNPFGDEDDEDWE